MSREKNHKFDFIKLLKAKLHQKIKSYGVDFQQHTRPYWEYLDRCVANRTPDAYQACDGVQLKITTNFITACLLEFLLIRIIKLYLINFLAALSKNKCFDPFSELSRFPI